MTKAKIHLQHKMALYQRWRALQIQDRYRVAESAALGREEEGRFFGDAEADGEQEGLERGEMSGKAASESFALLIFTLPVCRARSRHACSSAR